MQPRVTAGARHCPLHEHRQPVPTRLASSGCWQLWEPHVCLGDKLLTSVSTRLECVSVGCSNCGWVQVSHSIWALGRLQLRHAGLVAALMQATRRHLEALDAEQLAHILGSLATLAVNDRWLVRALGTAMLNRLHGGALLRPALAVQTLKSFAEVPAPPIRSRLRPASHAVSLPRGLAPGYILAGYMAARSGRAGMQPQPWRAPR